MSDTTVPKSAGFCYGYNGYQVSVNRPGTKFFVLHKRTGDVQVVPNIFETYTLVGLR